MSTPKTPAGGSDGAGPSSHRSGDKGGADQTAVKAVENVTAAQVHIDREAAAGTPPGQSGEPASGAPAGQDTHRTPEVGTPEHEARVRELAADPAHNGKITPKSRREAEVGLALEADGRIPGPIRRAPLDNSDPAFQKDQGEFIDANGNHWDVKSPLDVFPGGPMAGQPMPPGVRGRYDGDQFEQKLADELDDGQNVIIDTKNLSPGALADLKSRVAGHQDWGGRVVFDK